MTEQPVQPAPPAAPPPTRPGRLVWLSRWLPIRRSGLELLLSWLAPVAFMAIGYLAFPSLRAPVTLPWHAPGDIWMGLFTQLLLVFVWMIYEIWYTTHRNTAVAQLQADVAGDVTVALLLAAACAALVAKGDGLPWWFVVPLLGAIVDVYQSPILGINNAAEKPFVSTKGSS